MKVGVAPEATVCGVAGLMVPWPLAPPTTDGVMVNWVGAGPSDANVTLSVWSAVTGGKV